VTTVYFVGGPSLYGGSLSFIIASVDLNEAPRVGASFKHTPVMITKKHISGSHDKSPQAVMIGYLRLRQS